MRDVLSSVTFLAKRSAMLIVAVLALGSAAAAQPAATRPSIGYADAARSVYPVGGAADVARCRTDPDGVACLLRSRWATHADAWPLVDGLWRDHGTVAGVSEAFAMNGGYRGTVQIVPAMPVGRAAVHLRWIDRSLRAFDEFLTELGTAARQPIGYRWRALHVRFARSVRRRTPAAWAEGWTVTYNLSGGINDSFERVETTLFHEIFHLNDAGHHDWSLHVLQPLYARIVARCGARTACLAPYTPNNLRVRGGTFYSFQPGNDVREYAAELAVRYYLEQSGRWRGRPFKCGPAENVRAWSAMASEFFGGVDRTPPCR